MNAATNNGAQYRINFVNNSTNSGSIVLFQQDQNVGVSGAMSLVWFSKRVHPNTSGYFSWTVNYNFVWSKTGVLKPGVQFFASQAPEADLTATNSIGFTFDGAYDFVNQTAGSLQGNLYIKQDGTIPLNQVSVGIGMSGVGTFAVQAQPNTDLTFTPNPEYWICFGNFEQGEVLNVQEMAYAFPVQFPPGVYVMNALLNMDSSWTIVPEQ